MRELAISYSNLGVIWERFGKFVKYSSASILTMHEENTDGTDNKKRTASFAGTKIINNKVIASIIAASVVALITYGISTVQPSIAQIPGVTAPQEGGGGGGGSSMNATQQQSTTNPTLGYDVHVTVNRHDSMNLNAPIDHYCKLDKRIVAVCLLYAKDNNAKPGTGSQLSQVEFIITKDMYKQLPPRERANWHNHAVELTPERGAPSCVSLPKGLECGKLVTLLQGTYGKVITLWDPADAVPDSQPYAFNVESPYALGQDLNNNLAKEWPTGCGNTSSANLICGK
jgi:hypothetical protein